jgi:NAD(P)-dependent dehydrogenase (short-subunit alcohol dehydrogenase family)
VALRDLGTTVEVVEVDWATTAGVETLQAAARGRAVDALLTNAGHGLGRGFLDQEFEAIQHVIDTNVTGTVYLIHTVGRAMRARGQGRILITGSIAGFMPGERLSYARLPTGVRVIGVHAGYTLAFIRDESEKLRWAATPAEGSQFRSRDLFPQAAAAIALGHAQALGEDMDPVAVPGIPERRVAYIDGYGNLKTTIRADAARLRPSAARRVRVADITREAIDSDGSFTVPHGQMAFAPGSSGWQTRGSGPVRWMELFLRGGSAWEAFGHPSIGAEISFTE